VECRQTFLGRLVGYGDLEIDTASETGAEVFPQISQPLAFKRAIDSATSAFHATHAAAVAAAGGRVAAADAGAAGAAKVRHPPTQRLHHDRPIPEAQVPLQANAPPHPARTPPG